MQDTAKKMLTKYRQTRVIRKRMVSILLVLSVVVSSGVFWQLRLTGMSMTGEAYCGLSEHEHSDACVERKLVCTLADGQKHTHNSECYESKKALTCNVSEHTHTDNCYETVSELTCNEEHDHIGTCYTEQKVLACSESEHQHTDVCWTAEQNTICTQNTSEHVHTEACYEDDYTCGYDPDYSHMHTLQCYSNPEADVETTWMWEKTIEGIELTGVWSEDLLTIAKSQLGYQESTNNYQVMDDGTTVKGITRYGQWYGNSYGDWCAMFVSWCLNYAEIPNSYLPYHASCPMWIEALEKLDVYETRKEYTPSVGDIIFFDWEENGSRDGVSDHVGIVEELTQDGITKETTVHTIEGNSGNAVVRKKYDLNSKDILGYCNLDVIYQQYLQEHPVENEPDEIPEQMITNVGIFTDDTYSATYEGVADINILGKIPDGAVAKAYPVEVEIENCQIVCAFDITIFLADGSVYEPEEPLTVEIKTEEIAGSANVYYVSDEGDAEAVSSEMTEEGISFTAGHFSVYAVATTDDITCEITATSDEKAIQKLTLTLKSGNNKITYFPGYSDNGSSWVVASLDTIKPSKNGDSVTFELTDSAVFDSNAMGSANRQFAVCYSNKGTYSSGSISLKQIYDKIAPGFLTWLNNQETQTDTAKELADAFALYQSIPSVTLQRVNEDGVLVAVNAVLRDIDEPDESDEYHWQYLDSNSEDWQDFSSVESDLDYVNYDSEQSALSGAISEKLLDGAAVRCVLYREGIPVSTSNCVTLEPTEAEITAAIAAINKGLGLAAVSLQNGNTTDLSIGGSQFTDLFYYGNVARDTRVPFSDASTYAKYLAKTYINSNENLETVRTVWNRYLYDMYDPADDMGNMTNKNQGYPNGDTYGDDKLGWPKDANSRGSSPFHQNTTNATVKDLNYDYLENGVDYGNLITGLDKTAEAVAPGDENEDRLYDINLSTDVSAKVNAPVALIFQIQTSWQMFDLNHANALEGDGSTEVGAAAISTELANLYDIKNALLRLVDYMDTNYPGNNLVIGITDVEHAGTFSMFKGVDKNNKPLYVTNDSNVLRNGIIGWDTFGNCEHVHYTSQEFENAVENLVSNLYYWKDVYGTKLEYEDIRKVVVNIGGPTENSSGRSGYGVELPWGTFQKAGVNAVYGIQTNIGTPLNKANVTSWLQIPENNGTPFQDGVGTGFTKRYVATNEDAVLNTLLQIVQKEMKAQGINIFNPAVSVEDYVLEDVVTDEFEINYAKPFTLTVTNKVLRDDFDTSGSASPRPSDYVDVTIEIPIDMSNATVSYGENGERILTYSDISYEVPLLQSTETVVGNLVVTENPDGTTGISMASLDLSKTFNNSNIKLNFQVQARENYIGSNNVYTNVGTPVVSYSHEKPDGTVDNYKVNCFDTPEVNVPIRFDVVNGEATTIFVGENVEIADLAESIVADAEYRATLYDQIDGTLTYSWELPDGGTQSATVTIKNGVITDNNGNYPDYTHLFEGNAEGTYPGKLTVTFAPENTNDPDRLGVSELAKPGNVQITVVDTASTTKFFVEKQWPSGNDGISNIHFNLLCNGVVQCDGNGTPITYTLSSENDWKMLFEDMPAVIRDEKGNDILAVYSVAETPVPDGYSDSYAKDTESIPGYGTKVTDVELRLPGNIPSGRYVQLTFQASDGSDYTFSFTTPREMGKYEKDKNNVEKNVLSLQSFLTAEEISNLPLGGLDANGEPLQFWITKIVHYKNSKLEQPQTLNSFTSANAKVQTQKVENGTQLVDKLVIRNVPSFVLPETGGMGTLSLTLGALLIIAGALMYGCFSRLNRRGRRYKG